MMKDQMARRWLVNRLLASAALCAPIIAVTTKAAEAANILFENTLFLSGAAGATTKRTPAARWSDIINVLDFGADPTGAADSTTAIRSALTSLWGITAKGGILFFPPGNYKVTGQIDISNPNVGSNFTNGRIIGSGRGSTFIGGNVPNGFIFFQPDGANGPEEIAHMMFSNTSTWIASGALCFNNSAMVVHDCNFNGMINVLAPSNTFTACVNNCTGTPNTDVTTGTNGTLGVAGACLNVKNWRSTGSFQACIQLNGGNSCVLEGNGIENCATAILLGPATGWASSITVVPDGANPGKSIMTVGGNLGSTITQQFRVGSIIYGRGLPLQTWGADPNDLSGTRIVDDHGTDPTLTGAGFAGTYRIDQSATISTPIPIWSKTSDVISSCVINSHQSEACYHTIYVDNVSSMVINGGGTGSTPNECVDAFGTTGYTPRCGLYLFKAGTSKISGFAASPAATYLGSIVIDPSATITNLTFDSCTAQKKIDAVTDNLSTISNGSGGSGTILNVNASTVGGSFIGIGMAVTGSGVTAGTIITGNHASDPTLTGSGGAGTYRVNNAHNLSARVFTITSGADWVMPTAASAKAGLKFVNCGAANLPAGYVSGLNSLNMHFNDLPGQAGASNNVALIIGAVFDIIDCNSATPGATAAGGGSNKVAVRWNGTNWIVLG